MSAACNPFDLLNASACFSCLTGQQLQVVNTVLLCQILQAANPMATCDPQAILTANPCLSNLTGYELAVIQTELLCEILQAGGGGGQSCIICANADPTTAPACACALYYRKDNDAVWLWNADTSTWDQLIAP